MGAAVAHAVDERTPKPNRNDVASNRTWACSLPKWIKVSLQPLHGPAKSIAIPYQFLTTSKYRRCILWNMQLTHKAVNTTN